MPAGGDAVTVAIRLFDRAAHRDAEAAMRFLGGILEASTEHAIVGEDADGTIVLWNHGARRLYGREPEEVLGSPAAGVLHRPEDVRDGLPSRMREAARRAGRWEGVVAVERGAGPPVRTRVVVTPRRDGAGRVTGFLLISRDAAGELPLPEAADQARNRLLAGMSHELRNPLQAILGFTGLLLIGAARPAQRRAALAAGDRAVLGQAADRARGRPARSRRAGRGRRVAAVGARILIVEDNRANNYLMCYLLRAFGHTVFSARDGREGIEIALRERPDAIVMDLQMERMSGPEAAQRLAADPGLARIPRVAVTAYAMVGDREQVLEQGFDGYISKPIDPEAFVGHIEAHLPDHLRSSR